jgi:glutaredoxin-related protein
MKKLLIFCAMMFAVMMVSCKQEQATQAVNEEEILSISWSVENPMSNIPYVSIFSNNIEMICYQKIHTDFKPLSEKRDTIIMDTDSWDGIKSLLNLEKFLKLDDEYPLFDPMLQDYPSFFLEVKTNTRSKVVKYEIFEYEELSVIKKLDSLFHSKYNNIFSN